ncbi:MAG: PIF1 family DEAD/DEAH box helicase [Candidatus Nomurabacteria bacterium]|nr:PIF1 family DEAD/DEAH box helicase [Candidatus Nomurabacteria bacterium]
MTQDEALNILKTGASVFLTGEPGAGKTYTINSFVSYLRDHDIEPAITASTGIAATHIGGMTIHSWCGIGIKESLSAQELDKIASSEYVNRRIRKTKVLIIDEISMLRADTLDMVDAVCREIKQTSEAFGGIQVILVGDFFQLPPIFKREIATKQNALLQEKKAHFAYESNSWKRLKPVVCYISEQHRQDDKAFLELLSAIRSDTVEEEHYEYMKERFIEKTEIPENTTKLYSHNLDVDKVNDVMLEKINDEESIPFIMDSEGNEHLITMLKKGCLSPEVLNLKKGAVVMCTKNNIKEHFVNGTLGIVEDFDSISGNPIIITRSGKTIEIAPMDWVVEENGKIKAQISQIPLRLAWAVTIHKSQGMSMDAAVMDLSNVFEFGQGYVALSRVRRLSGVYLLGINHQALKVHPLILEQDKIFRKESDAAEKTFGKLLKNELNKMHKNFIVALGGEWKEDKKKKTEQGESLLKKERNHFDKLRETNPNAFRKWTLEDEEKLALEFKNGKSIEDLCEIFGRQVGGIKSRLVKLGLIEDDYKKPEK